MHVNKKFNLFNFEIDFSVEFASTKYRKIYYSEIEYVVLTVSTFFKKCVPLRNGHSYHLRQSIGHVFSCWV